MKSDVWKHINNNEVNVHALHKPQIFDINILLVNVMVNK